MNRSVSKHNENHIISKDKNKQENQLNSQKIENIFYYPEELLERLVSKDKEIINLNERIQNLEKIKIQMLEDLHNSRKEIQKLDDINTLKEKNLNEKINLLKREVKILLIFTFKFRIQI